MHNPTTIHRLVTVRGSRSTTFLVWVGFTTFFLYKINKATGNFLLRFFEKSDYCQGKKLQKS